MNADLIVETRKVGPLTVRVEYDDSGTNDPREWTNVSTIVEVEGRYIRDGVWGGYSSLVNYLIGHHDAIRETIDRIDLQGFSAYIFATPQGVEECGTPPEYVAEAVEQERRTYVSYLEGDVYGFVVLDEAGNVRDSCWGYIGEPEYAMSEGIEAATYDPRYQTWLGLQSACRGEGDER